MVRKKSAPIEQVKALLLELTEGLRLREQITLYRAVIDHCEEELSVEDDGEEDDGEEDEDQ
jgi:transcription elongation factor Elf1